jgi:hypothetical protein
MTLDDKERAIAEVEDSMSQLNRIELKLDCLMEIFPDAIEEYHRQLLLVTMLLEEAEAEQHGR